MRALPATDRYRHLLAATLLLLGLWLTTTVANAADQLTAEVDRTQVAGGETLLLTLTYSAQVIFGEPEFAALERDFDIVAKSRQSRMSIVNGKQESTTSWRLNLLPKRQGKLLIPSFNFKGAVSDALEIEVVATTGGTTTGAKRRDNTFVETLVDKNSAYIQEQILLTLRLYTAVGIDNLSVSPIEIPGAQVLEVAKSQYQKQIDGRSYRVAEIKLAIFAETSGTLTIPSVRFTGLIPDASDPFGGGFFSHSGRQLTLVSEEQRLTIKPRPPGTASAAWLPSTKVELDDHWSSTTATVGEPITRTITLRAQGLTGAQLPPLATSRPDDDSAGFRAYPDQPRIDNQTGATGITGQRVEATAIVPTRPGTIRLPATKVRWWNLATDRPEEALLPGKTLTVAAAAGTAPAIAGPAVVDSTSATKADESGSPSSATPPVASAWMRWLLVGNALSLGAAIVFAVLWWRGRRRPNVAAAAGPATPPRHDGALFKAIRVAAAARQLPALRQALLAWAAAHWPQTRIGSLRELAAMANDTELRSDLSIRFGALDACLYGGDSAAFDADGLLKSIERLRRQPAAAAAANRDLPPLYPAHKRN